VDLTDVGVVKGGDGPGFLLEAGAVLAFEALDGDDAAQARVEVNPWSETRS